MRVLVTAGSKHGATREIAAFVARALTDRKLDVDHLDPDAVEDLSPYQAVVLGSAVYAGHWTPDARTFADAHAAELAAMPLWLFSSGPVGKPAENPRDVLDLMDVLEPEEHVVFAGKIDKATLSFGERALVMALRAPEGDFREWEEIEEWANRIADRLKSIAHV